MLCRQWPRYPVPITSPPYVLNPAYVGLAASAPEQRQQGLMPASQQGPRVLPSQKCPMPKTPTSLVPDDADATVISLWLQLMDADAVQEELSLA